MKKKTLTVLCFVCLFSNVLLAQNFERIYIEKNGVKKLDHIAFYDENTQEVINTFNFEENNPFKFLNPYGISKAGGIYSQFDLRNSKYTTLGSLQSDLKGYSNTDLSQGISRAFLDLKVPHPRFHNNPNFITVCYNLHLFSRDRIKGFVSYLYILDKRGNIHAKFENMNYPFDVYTITDNGKYFGYGFGRIYDANTSNFFNDNYTIINLLNNSIVEKKKYSDDSSTELIKNHENLIQIERRIIDGYEMIFYDFEKKIKYHKTYSFKERGGLREITQKGLRFSDRFESYEDYFDKEYFYDK